MTDDGRKIIGFVPVREPQPGTIVTQAFIVCAWCGKTISTVGGPHRETLCSDCTMGAVTMMWAAEEEEKKYGQKPAI